MELRDERKRDEHIIDAPLDFVWRTLQDRTVLERVIPGNRYVSQLSDQSFGVMIRSRMDEVVAELDGQVSFEEYEAQYLIMYDFRGEIGNVFCDRGQVRIELVGEGRTTRVPYTVTTETVTGLTSIDVRRMSKFVGHVMDEIFDRVNKAVAGKHRPRPDEQSEEVRYVIRLRGNSVIALWALLASIVLAVGFFALF